MDKSKVAREQQIAVFGESGSGKTVLLSSFYGSALEPSFMKDSLFNVIADDTAQSVRLHQNYLGMKNSAQVPMTTRFSTDSYSFSIKRSETSPKAKKPRVAEELQLIWHDYPGDWFEQDPSGPTEAQRRVETFKSLLGSDVALLLVDGQKLLDNAGEEERYLKQLFMNFRNGLSKLAPDLTPDGKPLVRFPRIWIVGLSKSDLLPNIDVLGLRDLVIEKAGGELVELRKVLASLVDSSEALSVGEDFVLLSSAKFEAGTIAVNERIGVDLILPLAAVLPFSRFVKWADAMQKGGKAANYLMSKTGYLASLIGAKINLPGKLGVVAKLAGPPLADFGAKVLGDKVVEMNRIATAKHDFLTATLTGFQIQLNNAVKSRVFLRSLK